MLLLDAFLPLKIPGSFQSPDSLSYDFNGFSLCSYDFWGNSFLLFSGKVVGGRALRDVKFSEPLTNEPKLTALQPQPLVS